jgi:hypothetical protein
MRGDAEYIRKTYGVPARRGMRVVYRGGKEALEGTIVGFRGAHLRIRLAGENAIHSYHPTWKIDYLEGNG